MEMEPITIEFENESNVTFLLSPKIGIELKRIVQKETCLNFTAYCTKVGIDPRNCHNYLAGKRKLSLTVLKRFLSGIPEIATKCSVQIQIQKESGDLVEDVPCLNPEDMLLSEEGVQQMETEM